MALFRDDSGKTEKPTPDRLRQSRDKGSTPISKEFTMAGSLLLAVLMFEYLGWWLFDAFNELMRWGMNVNLAHHHLNDGTPQGFIAELEYIMGLLKWPYIFFAATFVIATLLFGFGQIGVKVSKKALGIKFEKLNPVNNLSKILSFSSIFKTFVSALKLCVLGSVLYAVVSLRIDDLTKMYEADSLSDNVQLIIELALSVFFWIALIVLLLAIADIAWQRFDFIKKNMMSKQEVEDERKRSDGDPFIKNRLKGARMKLMQQRMMDSVPKADVVITNPTHFSVALKYDRGSQPAPEVVARGVDDIALRIREIAKENNVPLMEDPPLARALFRATEVGQLVPERFYQAVAAVLSHVYRLQGKVA